MRNLSERFKIGVWKKNRVRKKGQQSKIEVGKSSKPKFEKVRGSKGSKLEFQKSPGKGSSPWTPKRPPRNKVPKKLEGYHPQNGGSKEVLGLPPWTSLV